MGSMAGEGDDTASFAGSTQRVKVDLGPGVADGEGADSLTSIDRVIGSRHADTLRGGPGADVLVGLGGSDLIMGNGGEDQLLGGTGADDLRGGGGADQIAGEAGTDRANGGPGRDTCLTERRRACEGRSVPDEPGLAARAGSPRRVTIDGRTRPSSVALPAPRSLRRANTFKPSAYVPGGNWYRHDNPYANCRSNNWPGLLSVGMPLGVGRDARFAGTQAIYVRSYLYEGRKLLSSGPIFGYALQGNATTRRSGWFVWQAGQWMALSPDPSTTFSFATGGLVQAYFQVWWLNTSGTFLSTTGLAETYPHQTLLRSALRDCWVGSNHLSQALRCPGGSIVCAQVGSPGLLWRRGSYTY
jgi:hypothetical protein